MDIIAFNDIKDEIEQAIKGHPLIYGKVLILPYQMIQFEEKKFVRMDDYINPVYITNSTLHIIGSVSLYGFKTRYKPNAIIEVIEDNAS